MEIDSSTWFYLCGIAPVCFSTCNEMTTVQCREYPEVSNRATSQSPFFKDGVLSSALATTCSKCKPAHCAYRLQDILTSAHLTLTWAWASELHHCFIWLKLLGSAVIYLSTQCVCLTFSHPSLCHQEKSMPQCRTKRKPPLTSPRQTFELFICYSFPVDNSSMYRGFTRTHNVLLAVCLILNFSSFCYVLVLVQSQMSIL